MLIDERFAQTDNAPNHAAGALAQIDPGAAIVTATRDASLRARIARAWGPELLAGSGALRLCVEIGQDRSSAPRAGTPIAVALTRPGSDLNLHATGVIEEVREPGPEQLRRVDEHWTAYRREATRTGISPRLIGRLIDRDGLACVTITVDKLSDRQSGRRPGVTS